MARPRRRARRQASKRLAPFYRMTFIILMGAVAARLIILGIDALGARTGLPGGEIFIPVYIIIAPLFGWQLRGWTAIGGPSETKGDQTMHNYFCDHCGAALDPGEICDCKQQPEESERRIVTYADWEAAGDFSKAAQPGDYVEERIVDDMRDVLPPAKMERGFLQVGEPYSHEFDLETGHWRGTFPTFVKEGQNWKYCGNCFIGKTTPPPAPIRR